MTKGDLPRHKFYALPKKKPKSTDVHLVEPTQMQVAQAQAQIKKEESINSPAKKKRKRSKALKPFE